MELVLIRGLPGTGKTTLGLEMEAAGTHVHCEADKYFVNSKGEYIFDGGKLSEAHKQCQDMARTALMEDKNVVVTNSFIKLRDMKFYVDLAIEFGATIKVLECHTLYGSKKNHPLNTILKFRQEWEEIDECADVDSE